MARYSTDTGWEVYAQNGGFTTLEDFVSKSPRGRKTYTNPNAKRNAWERAQELAVWLQREHEMGRGNGCTYVRIRRFESGKADVAVFEATPGTADWEKLLQRAKAA